MTKKKLIRIVLIVLFSFFAIFIYSKFNPKKKSIQPAEIQEEEIMYSANIIQGVNYVSKDLKGNEYIIEAAQGEIDLEDGNTIFLKSSFPNFFFFITAIARASPSAN